MKNDFHGNVGVVNNVEVQSGGQVVLNNQTILGPNSGKDDFVKQVDAVKQQIQSDDTVPAAAKAQAVAAIEDAKAAADTPHARADVKSSLDKAAGIMTAAGDVAGKAFGVAKLLVAIAGWAAAFL